METRLDNCLAETTYASRCGFGNLHPLGDVVMVLCNRIEGASDGGNKTGFVGSGFYTQRRYKASRHSDSTLAQQTLGNDRWN